MREDHFGSVPRPSHDSESYYRLEEPERSGTDYMLLRLHDAWVVASGSWWKLPTEQEDKASAEGKTENEGGKKVCEVVLRVAWAWLGIKCSRCSSYPKFAFKLASLTGFMNFPNWLRWHYFRLLLATLGKLHLAVIWWQYMPHTRNTWIDSYMYYLRVWLLYYMKLILKLSVYVKNMQSPQRGMSGWRRQSRCLLLLLQGCRFGIPVRDRDHD